MDWDVGNNSFLTSSALNSAMNSPVKFSKPWADSSSSPKITPHSPIPTASVVADSHDISSCHGTPYRTMNNSSAVSRMLADQSSPFTFFVQNSLSPIPMRMTHSPIHAALMSPVTGNMNNLYSSPSKQDDYADEKGRRPGNTSGKFGQKLLFEADDYAGYTSSLHASPISGLFTPGTLRSPIFDSVRSVAVAAAAAAARNSSIASAKNATSRKRRSSSIDDEVDNLDPLDRRWEEGTADENQQHHPVGISALDAFANVATTPSTTLTRKKSSKGETTSEKKRYTPKQQKAGKSTDSTDNSSSGKKYNKFQPKNSNNIINNNSPPATNDKLETTLAKQQKKNNISVEPISVSSSIPVSDIRKNSNNNDYVVEDEDDDASSSSLLYTPSNSAKKKQKITETSNSTNSTTTTTTNNNNNKTIVSSVPSRVVDPTSDGSGSPTSRNPCNCKKSRCLKLYCDCFAAKAFCKDCNCVECSNTDLPDHKAARDEAINAILERNPNAFQSKVLATPSPNSAVTAANNNAAATTTVATISITTSHVKGCNCKKSGCLKKYCECFLLGVRCSPNCKCMDCSNTEDSVIMNNNNNSSAASMLLSANRPKPGVSSLTPTTASTTMTTTTTFPPSNAHMEEFGITLPAMTTSRVTNSRIIRSEKTRLSDSRRNSMLDSSSSISSPTNASLNSSLPQVASSGPLSEATPIHSDSSSSSLKSLDRLASKKYFGEDKVSIPTHIALTCMSYLDQASLMNASMVSKNLALVALDKELWNYPSN